ncbi:MAG: hypothetical protein SWK76_13260 [Actinomycetota bacterium]|nr:hypothetical protein [Actinomycetota bacterium]
MKVFTGRLLRVDLDEGKTTLQDLEHWIPWTPSITAIISWLKR